MKHGGGKQQAGDQEDGLSHGRPLKYVGRVLLDPASEVT
jgi:hypothetical protein